MKSRTWMWTTAVYLFAALAMPALTAAQDNSSPEHRYKHHQYKLIDIGTLGGHYDFFNFSGAQNNLLSSRGVVAGSSDTTMVDPYCFGNPDCFVEHAFQWQDGILTDLGALPGGANSNAFAINARGVIAGLAQNGAIDPLLLSSPPPWGVQVMHAVTWEHGNITDLGTLGGYLSVAQAINDKGQVVGLALNDIPDPVSAFGLYVGTQMRAFLWRNGAMQDLGTLGGPDAWAYLLNQRGQVGGIAFTNSVINPATEVPTTDPFLWDAGNMQDLGTLGGTYGFANGLNARGQVVGQSNLAGDLTFHPFSWTKSGGMRDLGTFGGDNGQANALNDAGEIVGKADFPGSQIHDGFVWNHGVMTDLGTVDGDPCSDANGINSAGQVVGTSSNCHMAVHAFLWENGGPMVDLNTLIVPLLPSVRVDGSDSYINDQGEILSSGVLQNGDVHAFLLIPCDDKHPGQCEDYSMIEGAAPQISAPAAEFPAVMKQDGGSPVSPVERFRTMMRQRYQLSGQPAAPRD